MTSSRAAASTPRPRHPSDGRTSGPAPQGRASQYYQASPDPQASFPERAGHDEPADVPSISNAPESLAEDQARRTKRYLIQMGVRLVCFVAAIFVDGWLRWVFIAAAVILPYSAVLFANAGRSRQSFDVSPVERLELPAAPLNPPLAPSSPADEPDEPDDDAADRPEASRQDPDRPAPQEPTDG